MKLLTKLLFTRTVVAEATERFFLNISNFTGGGSITDAQGICTIEQVGVLHPIVNVSRSSGKAPLAVGFDATATVSGLTTRPDRDLFYIWDFGDECGDTFQYGATTGQSMNVGYGFIGGHVFKTAGTKTWTLTVMDGNGNVATTSGTITITDWAMADTYWIGNGAAPVPGVNGVPADAVNCSNQTTWAGIAALWAANKRYMLQRGHSWECMATTNMVTGTEINAFGSGAAPEITSNAANRTPFNTTSSLSDLRVVGVKHRGPGEGVAASGLVSFSNQPNTNVLVMDCEADRSTFGILAAGRTHELFVQNCNMHTMAVTQGAGIGTNLSLYLEGVYGLYVLGNSFADASSHVVRISGAQRMIFDSNRLRRCDVNAASRDAFTLRGFDDLVDPALFSGDYTEYYIISNTDADVTDVPTAQWVIQCKPTNPDIHARFRYGLVERNYVQTRGEPYNFTGQEYFTFRNNIGRSYLESGVSSEIGVSMTGVTNVGSPTPHDCDFYNNTFYRTGSSSNYYAIRLTSACDTITAVNNVAYAPDQANAVLLSINSATNVTETTNSTDTQVRTVRPWVSATPAAVADFVPSGTYAVNGGTALAGVQRDFYGAARTGTMDMGALQA